MFVEGEQNKNERECVRKDRKGTEVYRKESDSDRNPSGWNEDDGSGKEEPHSISTGRFQRFYAKTEPFEWIPKQTSFVERLGPKIRGGWGGRGRMDVPQGWCGSWKGLMFFERGSLTRISRGYDLEKCVSRHNPQTLTVDPLGIFYMILSFRRGHPSRLIITGAAGEHVHPLIHDRRLGSPDDRLLLSTGRLNIR